jgi:hypothetical protein
MKPRRQWQRDAIHRSRQEICDTLAEAARSNDLPADFFIRLRRSRPCVKKEGEPRQARILASLHHDDWLKKRMKPPPQRSGGCC